MKMCSLPPIVAGEVGFGTAAIWGEVVNIMRLPDVMVGPHAARAVLEGLELVLRRGSRVIGLGALTAPATGGGLSLLRHLPAGVTLTNGNAYTAVVVRQNVIEASRNLGLDRRAKVAVVGCTGSVGVPASHLLAEAGFDLTLVGRSARKVKHLLGCLASQAVFAGDLETISEADIVVVLTNDPSAQLTPAHVRTGAVIIDCAQPKNIKDSALEQFRQRNILVCEGGIVRIPCYSTSTDILGLDREDTFACLAETYLFAREGIREHSVGRPTPEFALRLERIAQRHGVIPRPLNIDQAFRQTPAGSSRSIPGGVLQAKTKGSSQIGEADTANKWAH